VEPVFIDAFGATGPPPPKANISNYFATGMVNSAPFAILSGQRCMMLL
jgi:hypothetical protein